MTSRLDKSKISVQMWSPLIAKLNSEVASACVNRDAYLDLVFAHEARALVHELEGRRNSNVARAFIKKCFLELRDLQPTSFRISTQVVEQITQACDQANTWRDVFVNRVIYFLVANSAHIEPRLGISITNQGQVLKKVLTDSVDIYLQPRVIAIRGLIRGDPFAGIRAALEDQYPDTKGALHMQLLGNPSGANSRERGLLGFSTFLDDEFLPGKQSPIELLDIL